MRHLRGQEGVRKALGGHREGRVLVYPPLYWGVFATRVSRGEFTVRGKEGRLPHSCIEVFSAKIEFWA